MNVKHLGAHNKYRLLDAILQLSKFYRSCMKQNTKRKKKEINVWSSQSTQTAKSTTTLRLSIDHKTTILMVSQYNYSTRHK